MTMRNRAARSSIPAARDAAAMWDIAVPSRPGRVAGVRMAGFSDRVRDLVDLQTVPYPAVTLVIDIDGGLVVDDPRGRRHRGSIVAGLAPDEMRVRGRGIEALQVRLSPLVAHAVLGGCAELWAG